MSASGHFDAYTAFSEGMRLLADGNVHAAVIALEQARELEPAKGSVRRTLARPAYFRTGRFAAAEQEFNATLDIEPVNDYAQYGVGLCRLKAGDRARAAVISASRRSCGPTTPTTGPRSSRSSPRASWTTEARGDVSSGAGTSRPVVCCDLDGVVWRGETPIDGVGGRRRATARCRSARRVPHEQLERARARQRRRLAAAGVDPIPTTLVTSAQAAAALLATRRRPGAGCSRARARAWSRRCWRSGFETGRRAPSRRGRGRVGTATSTSNGCAAAADGVRCGRAVRRHEPRPDLSGRRRIAAGRGFARRRGRRPRAAAGPRSRASPNRRWRTLVRARYGDPVVMIGDRPSTDGAFAAALGVPFALVLSGVAGTAGEEPVPDPPPPFVAADLGALAPQLVAAFAAPSR